jgi:hypothetical protein
LANNLVSYVRGHQTDRDGLWWRGQERHNMPLHSGHVGREGKQICPATCTTAEALI